MYVVGVDLVKVCKASIRRLVSGAPSVPLLMSMSEAFSVLLDHNKTSATQVSEAWSLVPKLNLLRRSHV